MLNAISLSAAVLSTALSTTPLPEGYWSREKSQTILEKTLEVRLDPDLSHLTHREQQALEKLIGVGHLFQSIYESSRHHQAQEAHERLEALDAERGSPVETQNLLKLYRLFRGPIATTLENTREPFLPVDKVVPGKNVYPWGLEKSDFETYLEGMPEQRPELLEVRRVVRRPDRLRLDLSMLHRYGALQTLHPALRPRLEALLAEGRSDGFYSVPYALAYAEEMHEAFGLLFEAAALLEDSDAQLAQYLRNRARDLLSNDYESGDASWVSGRFAKLNAQIGAYEVYDDELYAAKAFYAVSLLQRDPEQSNALSQAIRGIQELEDSLPYGNHKRVREDLPVGVYNVIADFGQSRGTNTATILPNESYIVRKYGRTILLRYNIMTHPDLFANSKEAWDAAVVAPHHDDYQSRGNFYRTLWHEIGHYLGPDLTKDGRAVDAALEENSSAFEEMKADLISLFLAKKLHASGYYDDARLAAVYASGIRRVLRPNKPRRSQAYGTMQLMQLNYFLEKGLLMYDVDAKRLHIAYDRYHQTVEALLRAVLSIQYDGNKQNSDDFIERYSGWDDDIHGVLAANMRAAQKYRYRLVWYGALGE